MRADGQPRPRSRLGEHLANIPMENGRNDRIGGEARTPCFACVHALYEPGVARRFPRRSASTRRRSISLLPGLLGEPFVEHGARKANVSSYSMAGQTASPDGLIDPARLDV